VKPIRCLLVDDERLARSLMRQLIASAPELDLVGEAEDVDGARAAVQASRPEAVFLDIGLPDGDGFGLMGLLGPDAPAVVFVTAYDQHALRAFESEVMDYLVKPVEPSRFQRTVARLKARLRPWTGDDASRNAGAIHPKPSVAVLPTAPEVEPLFVKAGSAGRFVAPQDILWIRSDRNYTEVKLVDGSVLTVRQTLAEWAKALPSTQFLQLDRTLIVHLARVRLTEVTATAAVVRFRDASASMSMGRRAAERLKLAMAAAALRRAPSSAQPTAT
jgi:two-component system LytT family response regulator